MCVDPCSLDGLFFATFGIWAFLLFLLDFLDDQLFVMDTPTPFAAALSFAASIFL